MVTGGKAWISSYGMRALPLLLRFVLFLDVPAVIGAVPSSLAHLQDQMRVIYAPDKVCPEHLRLGSSS